MKILLDHALPHALRHHFPPYCEVYTTHFMGWSDLDNSALIQAALGDGFDVVVTLDRNLGFQQDLGTYPIGVIFLRTHPATLPHLLRLMPAVEEVLPHMGPGRHLTVFR